ncbi:DUF1176 domain-containing protein [Acinetobacter sp. ANC 4173]|nr:DUF1176 domain-containing protein [Acinetobacter sp. ANC 4173]TCB78527.1 DUF1176 domain-containing protein [Acinetobacter sp. ANC 4173]
MKFIAYFISTTCLATVSTAILAQDIQGMSFSHEDWELYCSNTGTCRAAGYQNDDVSQSEPVSLLLTRHAGAKQAVTVEFALASFEAEELPVSKVRNIHFFVNGRDLGAVNIEGNELPLMGTLSNLQVNALLQVAAQNAQIEFKNQNAHWQISDNGMTATLLKMDDFQKRLNTVGALIKKGRNSEAGVLAAAPKFVVKQVKTANQPYRTLAPTQAHYQTLSKTLMSSQPKTEDVGEGFCDGVYTGDGQEPQSIQLYKLSGQKVLATTLCWRAAYNEGYGMWVLDASLKGPATFITETASDFSEGRIQSAQKGRGIGDCWSIAEWVWNGQQFVQTVDRWTGMCKGLAAGGVWDLDKIEAVVK